MKISGNLAHVDENLNFFLNNMKVVEEEKNPYLVKYKLLIVQLSCKNGFIRGNVVRYVHLQKKEVDVEPLTEACKKEAKKEKPK